MTNQKSIAVLPFDNLSSDPENEYFSEGMTEEIIAALSKIKGLKVIARTSSFAFKGKREDVRIIGNKLGVETVVEGSIRKSGNRVRISAQLSRTDHGFQIWSDTFDRELSDVFELQDEISLLIADKIRENFGHLNIQDRLVKASTDSIEAYDLYLKGRFFLKKWTLEDIAQGARYYEESTLTDPTFDLPFFGAGMCYSLLGSWGYMNKSEAFELTDNYFQKGRALNSDSLLAYHCMATHALWGLWDYQKAQQYLEAALQINTEEPDINECMAELCTAIGDFDAALSFIDKSLSSDPLSPNHFYTKANIFYLQGQFDQALNFINQSLALDAAFALAINLKIACYIHLGNRTELTKALHQFSIPVPAICELLFDVLHGDEADTAEATLLIEQFENSKPRPLFAWDLYLLAQLNHEEALKLLITQTGEQLGQVVNFKHEKFLTPLHHTTAFSRLAKTYFLSESLKATVPQPTIQEKELIPENETAKYIECLSEVMDSRSKYLDTQLNLKTLAEVIGLNPNKLSWLLNEKIGKNFNDYVNGYRLEAFKRKALDPANSRLTLLGVAYESGFNSKSVFNDFFKKNTGLTPKAWVKANKK